MKSVEENVVMAMDGSDIELFPFLPYILQDLWKMGSDPEVITKLIGKHFTKNDHLKVLDLGCGKGAVSIEVAHKLGCNCHGIDAIPEFISYAQKKAVEYNVEHLCKFETGDIRKTIKESKLYDVIILGSIGPIFGDYFTTLSTLLKCLNDSGMFMIDDGYIEDNSDYIHPLICKKHEVMQQIDLAGMKLIEEVIIKSDHIKESDVFIYDNIKKRCIELINKHPEKKYLFENYIKKQEEENDVLENKVICSTMAIKRKREEWRV